MHFHLPKPMHGWREFAGEVGVIVLGVLIALGAEQAIDSVHRRSEAREARSEIEAEVVTDITRIKQRALNADCVDARLNEMDQIIDSENSDGTIRRPSLIGRPPRYAIETMRWDAASQSGRVSLLPSDWQAQFGFLYTVLRYHYQTNTEEEAVWSRLNALSGIERITPEVRFALKQDIAQARFDNASLRQVANIILDRAARAGLHPAKRHDPPFNVCWPTSTSPEMAAKLMASRNALTEKYNPGSAFR
jgi:hypothetical protein